MIVDEREETKIASTPQGEEPGFESDVDELTKDRYKGSLVVSRPERSEANLLIHHTLLFEPTPEFKRPIKHQLYGRDVLFTPGIGDAVDRAIMASGEDELACKIAYIRKSCVAGRRLNRQIPIAALRQITSFPDALSG
jgi:hypothetical protein